MRIALLTLHDLADFPIHEWLKDSGLADNINIDAFVDEESQTILKRVSGFNSISCYENYLTNGKLAWDVLKEHKKNPYERIVFFGEDDVIRAAMIAEKLGLPGNAVSAVRCYRDKFMMRECLKKNGYTNLPRFAAINHALDLIDFCEANPFPVFIKPRSSSGSTCAQKISDQDQLVDFLEKKLSSRIDYSEYTSDLIVESFVEGQMVHVDGWIDSDGKIEYCFPSKYLSKNLELGNLTKEIALSSVMLDHDDVLFQKLVAVTHETVASLPMIKSSPFHAEFFVCSNGELILCEIAARTGGAGVNEAVALATGVNLNKLSFYAALGILDSCPSPKNARGGWSLVNPIGYTLKNVPDPLTITGAETAHFYFSAGDTMGSKDFSGAKAAKLIAVGATSLEVENNLKLAIGDFMRKSTDQPGLNY